MSKKQYKLSELVPGKLHTRWHDEMHTMHALAPDGSPACGRPYYTSTGTYPDSTLANVQCGTCRRIVNRAFGFVRNHDDDWTLKLPDHGLELLVPTNGEPDAIVCDAYDRVRYRKAGGASHWLGALAVWALACANGEDTASDEPEIHPLPNGVTVRMDNHYGGVARANGRTAKIVSHALFPKDLAAPAVGVGRDDTILYVVQLPDGIQEKWWAGEVSVARATKEAT